MATSVDRDRAANAAGGRTLARVTEGRTMFLFDPSPLCREGRELPVLLSRIGPLEELGEGSSAFGRARKSDRQIIRILANLHYPPLRSLARSLEACVEAGCEQPAILRTRDAAQFRSAVSELLFANHLRARGYLLRRVEPTSTGGVIPEFIAVRGGTSVAVEVYAPRQWEELDALTDEIKHGLENADLPFDFEYELSINPAERIDEHGQLAYPDPWAIAGALSRERREQIVDSSLGAILGALAHGDTQISHSNIESSLNLHLSARVTNARRSLETLPARQGFISHLGANGYAPEAMFEGLVDRMHAKATRRQGPNSPLASASLLVVDLTYAELTSELWNGYYRKNFEASLRRRMETPPGGYDLVALCSWSATDAVMRTHYVVTSDPSADLASPFDLA